MKAATEAGRNKDEELRIDSNWYSYSYSYPYFMFAVVVVVSPRSQTISH